MSRVPRLVVLSAIALRPALTELTRLFEADTASQVDLIFDTNPLIAKRIEGGDPFDVVVINPHLIEQLIERDHIEAGTMRSFGQSPMGLGCHREHEPVDISTVGSFVAILARASSIGYTPHGTSGRRLVEMLGRLGVADKLRDKLKPLAGGDAGRAVADEEVEYSIVPITTIMASNAVLVGVLPEELEPQIEFAAALSHDPANRSAALAFLDLLVAPHIDALIATKGVSRVAAVRSASQ